MKESLFRIRIDFYSKMLLCILMGEPNTNPYDISYHKLENDLNQLDDDAWQEFIRKVVKYVCIKDKKRK